MQLKKLLKRSTLSRDDRQIAVSCLIWDMDYIEIGAAVHMDRTTVSRRMRKIIAPQLEMLQGREKDRAGAKCSGFFSFLAAIIPSILTINHYKQH